MSLQMELYDVVLHTSSPVIHKRRVVLRPASAPDVRYQMLDEVKIESCVQQANGASDAVRQSRPDTLECVEREVKLTVPDSSVDSVPLTLELPNFRHCQEVAFRIPCLEKVLEYPCAQFTLHPQSGSDMAVNRPDRGPRGIPVLRGGRQRLRAGQLGPIRLPRAP